MLEFCIVESRRTEMRLSTQQAEMLSALGRELASNAAFWGSSDQDVRDSSVIDVQPQLNGMYAVTFRNVVGALTVDDLHIRVRPKIPESHFFFIAGHSELAPKVTARKAELAPDADLMWLVARWCITEIERLLVAGLEVDYTAQVDMLEAVRGTVEPVSTAMLIACGRPLAVCEFEELGQDSARNRVLKAACTLIAAKAHFPSELRRRANRVASRMDSVGPVRHGDRRARVTSLSKRYARALPLAVLVLEGGGISARVGEIRGTGYLIRTPDLIESGIRSILRTEMAGFSVEKTRKTLAGTAVTLHPDLNFANGRAVGDVKYRYFDGDWHRASLYQCVAFATGFGSTRCAVVGFVNDRDSRLPPEIPVGPVSARVFGWIADGEIPPQVSASELATSLRNWIQLARRDAMDAVASVSATAVG
jgi:5-methylcytosine-specific restriction enzyme subunit McrC